MTTLSNILYVGAFDKYTGALSSVYGHVVGIRANWFNVWLTWQKKAEAFRLL